MTQKPKAFTFFNVFRLNLDKIFIQKFIRNFIRNKNFRIKTFEILFFIFSKGLSYSTFIYIKKSRIR